MAACRSYVIVWLTVVISTDLNHLVSGSNQQIEERARLQPMTKIKKALKSENLKEGLPDIVSSFGGIGALISIDYSQDPITVFKNIGDALIPMLVSGLALIPGGNLIGGIVSATWSIVSALFGGPPQKSPMELAVENLRDNIKALQKHVQKLPSIVLEHASKQTNAKLKSIFNRAIHGEMSRNRYVCNKYSMISHDFSDDLKANRSINESRRIEMVASMHNCDNFLKDTSEAFVFPEFADVLWIPSVYTTLTRVAFLTEICNYGVALQLDKSILSSFWSEMTTDLQRHFKFAAHGIEERVRLAYAMRKKDGHKDMEFLFYTFSPIELDACKAQKQLLYIDREIYPFGVPENLIITMYEDELNVTDFNVTLSNEPRHIQIFYNDVTMHQQDEAENLLNCITGPVLMQHVVANEMTFRVSYVPNKSYQLRILYFTKKVEYTYEMSDDVHSMDIYPKTSDRSLVIKEEGDTIKVVISSGKPNENNLQRFLWETGYNILQCIYDETCNADAIAYEGTFIIESVGIFNVLKDDELKGKIHVQVQPGNYDRPKVTVILGAELIIRHAMQ